MNTVPRVELDGVVNPQLAALGMAKGAGEFSFTELPQKNHPPGMQHGEEVNGQTHWGLASICGF